MKTTRKQAQVIKANKVKTAAYKANRRSPIQEEVYVPPVRLKPSKQNSLYSIKLIKKDMLIREALKYFPADKAREVACKLISYTAEYAIKDLTPRDLQGFILSESPLRYFLKDEGVGNTLLLEAMEKTPYEYWYKQPILQLYIYAYGCAPEDVVELDHVREAYNAVDRHYEVLNLREWAKNGFPIDPNFINGLDYRWANPQKPKVDTWDDLKEYGKEITKDKKNKTSIFDLLHNWEVLSSQELFNNTVKDGITPQDIIQWMNEGKHRMIRKASKLDADVLTCHGIPVNGKDASNLTALLETGNHKLNMKAAKKALDFKDLDYDKLVHYIVLGEHGINLPRSLHVANYAADVDPIPEGMKKLVAANEQLINAIFSEGVSVDWSIHPKSAKECVIGSIMIQKGITRSQAETWLQNPSIDESIEYAKANKPELECTLPEVHFEEEGYTLTRLPKDALENLFMGELTSCCQKLGGFGEDVCTEGWTDKHSVNYIFKTPSNNICAHFWAWEAQDGSIIIDSIEGRSSADTEIIAELTAQFVDHFNGQGIPVYLSQTPYGITEEVTTLFKEWFELEEVSCPREARVEEYSYKDAHYVVFKIN